MPVIFVIYKHRQPPKGDSCNKSPIIVTSITAKVSLLTEPNISVKRIYIWHYNSFDTIDIPSIIITLRSEKWFLKLHFFLSWNSVNFISKIPTGFLKAMCIVVPSICIAATPIGTISNTLGFSITTSPYDRVFVSD